MPRGMEVTDTITPTLSYMIATVGPRTEHVMSTVGAPMLQQYAQDNAPWSDITGDARRGLTADSFLDGGQIVVELGHTVDYGYWLEVIRDGAYAILLPTVEALAEEIAYLAGSEVIETGGFF